MDHTLVPQQESARLVKPVLESFGNGDLTQRFIFYFLFSSGKATGILSPFLSFQLIF